MNKIVVSDIVGEYVSLVENWEKSHPSIGKYSEVDYDEVLVYAVIFVSENCSEKLTDVDLFCTKIIELFDYCYECVCKHRPSLKNRILKEGFAMDMLFKNFLGKMLNKNCNFVDYFKTRF